MRLERELDERDEEESRLERDVRELRDEPEPRPPPLLCAGAFSVTSNTVAKTATAWSSCFK
jgi:hypothetical protein